MERTSSMGQRRRAGSLGIGLAAACSLLAAYLLKWSGSQVIAAGWEPVDVADAVNWCIAALAGAVALALAWSCLVGAGHLLHSPASLTLTACSPGGYSRMAPRVAALLLALTLGSPPALADAVGESAAVSGGSVVRIPGPDFPGPPHSPDPRNSTAVTVPDWRPVRSDLPAPPASTTTTNSVAKGAVRESEDKGIVVRRGDSLWGIAARELGPGASEAQISARWPQWYDANLLTIGPDPDVILPGHILNYPDSTPGCPTIGVRP